MQRRAIVLLCAIVALIAYGSLVDPDCAPAADTIRIGFVADATGIGSKWYKSQRSGMELFIEEINAAGGVLGKKLELVERDAKLNPKLGAQMARELIEKEKCLFLMGPTSSGVAIEVLKVSRDLKTIVCLHTSNSEGLTTTYFQPYMVQVVPNTGIESRGIAMFLANQPYTRYAYLGPDYDYARNFWQNFRTALSERKPGVQFLEVIWTPLGKTDFSADIPKLVVQKPEVVFTNLWGDALVSFIEQCKAAGLAPKCHITSLFDLDMLRTIGLDMPEGVLGYARCPFYGVSLRQMRAFADKYNKKYGMWPADWAIMAYDGLTALTEAIKKAQSTDSDKVVKALEGLQFKSLRGEVFIRPEDHMANVGVYVGWTTKDPRYNDNLIMKDVTKVPADMVWLPVEEVKKLQNQGKAK